MSLIFLNGDIDCIWCLVSLCSWYQSCPGGSLVGRAPAAPPFLAQFAGRFFSEGKAGPSGWEGTLHLWKSQEQNTSCASSRWELWAPKEHLDTPVLPNPCQKEDKQGHSCVYHLKVNLVHVKGAGNTTQTIHNAHFSYTLT